MARNLGLLFTAGLFCFGLWLLTEARSSVSFPRSTEQEFGTIPVLSSPRSSPSPLLPRASFRIEERVRDADPSGGNSVQGPYAVQTVIDGDTMDVLVEGRTKRVRVIGMDTPETKDTRTVVECFGREASAQASKLLEGRNVYMEFDPSQGEWDKYKRLLRHVFVDDGGKEPINFALEMIADGYAFEYTYHVPSRYQAEYQTAEREARRQEKGLWSVRTCNGKRGPARQTGTGAVR